MSSHTPQSSPPDPLSSPPSTTASNSAGPPLTTQVPHSEPARLSQVGPLLEAELRGGVPDDRDLAIDAVGLDSAHHDA